MERYQDYVIKDGQFIGKFEEMYQKFDDPWHQSEAVMNQQKLNSYSRMNTVINLNKYGIKSIIEFGCGFGYYTHFLSQHTQADVLGVDISPTAIEKAKKLWPHLKFSVGNVSNLEQYRSYEAILFAEISWYILPDLKTVFEKMFEHFEGKYFFHNLVFYKGQQKYGREYFSTLKEFIEYVPFTLKGYSEATTSDSDTIETSTVFKIEKKGN